MSAARRDMPRKQRATAILFIGIVNVVIFATSMAFAARLDHSPQKFKFYAGGLIAIAILTFSVYYYYVGNMREAIAAAFIFTYFIVVSELLFLPDVRDTLKGQEVSTLNKLNTFVAVVLGFYFGGELIEKLANDFKETRIEEKKIETGMTDGEAESEAANNDKTYGGGASD
jgi:hypothetical protein